MVDQLHDGLQAVNSALIDIQNLIRSDFDWDVTSDYESANYLALAAANLTATNNAVERLKECFSGAERVVILGAAVEPNDLLTLEDEAIFVAADGSVGVFDELPPDIAESAWRRLALVVSDADGGEATMNAIRQSIPFALHAHGDNKE